VIIVSVNDKKSANLRWLWLCTWPDDTGATSIWRCRAHAISIRSRAYHSGVFLDQILLLWSA